jgi:aryl-alcohol dehydrogenase-like predicted oxidoreductase
LIASGRFDSMMICFNLTYQGAGAYRNGVNPPQTALSLARGQNMGTVTMRTLTSEIFQRWVAQVAPVVSEEVDWGGALLGFNLSHPQVDVAVVGMRSAEEVDRNVDIVESGRYRVDLAALHGEFAAR